MVEKTSTMITEGMVMIRLLMKYCSIFVCWKTAT